MFISVRVYPNAARSGVVGFTDGVLQVRVTAPPVKGRANRELIALLSHILGIGKSRIEITKGQTARNKLIAIDGLTQEEVLNRLLYRDSRP
jgi:hypothetical protein